jgi:hypothetical protein
MTNMALVIGNFLAERLLLAPTFAFQLPLLFLKRRNYNRFVENDEDMKETVVGN